MPLHLKPGHKSIEACHRALAKFNQLGVTHETTFQELLDTCARPFNWKLVPEYKIKRKGRHPLSANGTLRRFQFPTCGEALFWNP